jgi:hypothetical protein
MHRRTHRFSELIFEHASLQGRRGGRQTASCLILSSPPQAGVSKDEVTHYGVNSMSKNGPGKAGAACEF